MRRGGCHGSFRFICNGCVVYGCDRTSAAILCTLLAWVVRTEKRGDETSMPEDVRTGDSKTMTQTVGFFPRREQAFCIIAGFSMVGWGFYQINEVAVLNVDAIASLPPIFFACSTLLYTSALFFIWNRYVRNREVLLASFIAIIWFASAMVIIGLQYLGCHNDASPDGAHDDRFSVHGARWHVR